MEETVEDDAVAASETILSDGDGSTGSSFAPSSVGEDGAWSRVDLFIMQASTVPPTSTTTSSLTMPPTPRDASSCLIDSADGGGRAMVDKGDEDVLGGEE